MKGIEDILEIKEFQLWWDFTQAEVNALHIKEEVEFRRHAFLFLHE